MQQAIVQQAVAPQQNRGYTIPRQNIPASWQIPPLKYERIRKIPARQWEKAAFRHEKRFSRTTSRTLRLVFASRAPFFNAKATSKAGNRINDLEIRRK